MNPTCPPIQERLLTDPSSATAQAHLLGCEACSLWWSRTERLIGALGTLSRFTAPAELSDCVAELLIEDVEAASAETGELSSGQADKAIPEKLFERELRRLTRLPVPAMLDDLVLNPREADRSSVFGSVANLFRHPAPPVLARLVAEELAEPARHRVERFAGDLERPVVPTALDDAVPVALGELTFRVTKRTSRSSELVRRMMGPIVAMAAGVMLWTSLDSSFAPKAHEPAAPQYRFNVVRATSIDQLSPLTQSFLQGMTRGALPSSTEESGGSPR
ncbi:MAG: hypothetical protein ACI8TQ_000604 [Planctomycetota bacterium]|jgi:hypothetical protein